MARDVARSTRKDAKPAFFWTRTVDMPKTSKPVRSCSPRLGRFDSGAAPLSQTGVLTGGRGRVVRWPGHASRAARDRSKPANKAVHCGKNVADPGRECHPCGDRFLKHSTDVTARCPSVRECRLSIALAGPISLSNE